MTHLLLAVIFMAFISLGLPDSILGAAWPTMYPQLGVDVSMAGGISMIIAFGTIVSSLLSDRLTRWLGAGRVTAVSVGMTAVALLGFSFSSEYWMLCLWAIPYGLGAGSVDTALNNYVALHYASRHMSWLHCMWGVGTATGPCILGWALSAGRGWEAGYRTVGTMQVVLSVLLVLSLPLWKGRKQSGAESGGKALSLGEIWRIPGAKAVMLTFFGYCAVESTAGLWASSYLVLHHGVEAAAAARFASLFYVGITVGRALSGFMTYRLNDRQMTRLGLGVLMGGIVLMLLPLGAKAAMTGLVVCGLGCAPIYPSMIHATPKLFGAERSQAIIGVQMASAYVGTCLMPPLFGLIAESVSVALYPLFLLVFLALMFISFERLLKAYQ